MIRHGQTDSNTGRLVDTAHPGAPLNSVGLAQADELAERLVGHPIEGVYSSDLTRAAQTAAPLASGLGLPVVQLRGLREIPAGQLEMSSQWQSYIDALLRWAADPGHRLPGGETAVEFAARYDEAIMRIASAGHRMAALVSHGAAMRVWLQMRTANVSDAGTRRLANTEVVVLEGSPEGGWAGISWGDEPLGLISNPNQH